MHLQSTGHYHKYILESCIVALFISLVLIVFLFLNKNGYLFFHHRLPQAERHKIWFQLAIIIGLILPLISLYNNWPKPLFRNAFIAYILTQFFQVTTEFIVANYFFISAVIPTGI